jgi:hypothetical protein
VTNVGNTIALRILNEQQHNVLQYLPYGVTTIEMKVEGEESQAFGFVSPKNQVLNKTNNNVYVGYSDGSSQDFLVLWGGGKEQGLEINSSNANARLFLNILHKGKSLENQNLSLIHSKLKNPIATIKLIPAKIDDDLVKMQLTEQGESCNLTFKGNRIPTYYSRWFPPRPLENKKIQYYDIQLPFLEIKFSAKHDNNNNIFRSVTSDLDILLDNNRIAQVTGDWRYSWPHAELFTVLDDSRDFIVLRLWMYWIHKNFSNNFFRSADPIIFDVLDRPDKLQSSSQDDEEEQKKRGILESLDIEVPDIERFDFLIDIKNKKIIWLGTDFHYQEFWYFFENSYDKFVKARIGYHFETIVQVIKNLKDRMNPPQNYDPMTTLKKMLEQKQDIKRKLTLVNIQDEIPKISSKHNDINTRGQGIGRKHIPYPENGIAAEELISSVVTA